MKPHDPYGRPPLVWWEWVILASVFGGILGVVAGAVA